MKIIFYIFIFFLIGFSVYAQPNFGDSVQVSVTWDFQIQNGSSGAVGDGQSGTTCPQIQILVNGVNAQDFDWYISTPGQSQSFSSNGGSSSAGNFTQGQSITLSIVMGGNTVWQTEYTVSGTYNDGNFWHAYPTVGSGSVIVVGNDCSISNSAPPCFTNLTFTYNNNNPDYRIFAVGTMVGDQQNLSPNSAQPVPPGGQYQYTETVACSNVDGQELFISMPGEDSVVPTGLGPNGGSTNSSSGSSFTNSTVLPDGNTNSLISYTNDGSLGYGTNGFVTQTPSLGVPQSNILWSAASSVPDDSGVIAAVKDSASVAHNDASDIGAAVEKDLQTVASDISALSTNLNVNLNVSNLTLGLTNFATESTLESFTNDLLGMSAVTNWGSDFLTNGPGGSNYPTEFTNWVMGYTGPTNYSTLKAQSDALVTGSGVDTVESGLSGYITGFSDPSSGMEDYYPAQDMTFTFNYGLGSQVMDFDPLHNAGIAEIFAIARQFFVWLIAFKFLLRISEDGIKVVMVMQNARGVSQSSIRAAMQKPGSGTN